MTRVLRRRAARHVRRIPIRARLAASITALFVLAGATLLTVVVTLTHRGTEDAVKGDVVPLDSLPKGTATSLPHVSAPAPQGQGSTLPTRVVTQTALEQMLTWSAIGLVLLSLVVGVASWHLARRALRPVRAVTLTARRIGQESLHERTGLRDAMDRPHDEVQELAYTFDEMLGRLERSFETQRRFVANASHELRTPLTAARLCLEVGLGDEVPDHVAEVRETALTINKQAGELIDSLLILARGDSGIELPVEVALHEVVALAYAESDAAADKARIDRRCVLEETSVRGDPVLLKHLVTNLLVNAVRYNHPGGTLQVTLRDLALTVTNTGERIPGERVPELTQPFTRGTTDRTDNRGHGLGLSIVHSIALAHRADLTIEANEAGGLTVRVAFPEPGGP
ncbi:ATP-binding protein [Streptomyces pathocidini]|uniref:histidine kinase n=1 Tax=Streptomyces pathocidini TaxID=1650571 RepID=A0ABW7UPC1_9ACTN|nr:HAMP domain-containing sensor histidine kinase [Streptomyces pathocidini]